MWLGWLCYRFVQLLADARDVPLLQDIWTASGSTQPPIQWYQGFFPWGKHTSAPPIFLCGVDRDNYIFICAYGSWDSAVSVVTGLLAGWYRIWILASLRLFSSPKCLYQLWGPPSLVFNGYRGSFLGLQPSVHEVDHSPPLMLRLGMSGTLSFLPCRLSWCGQALYFLYACFVETFYLFGIHPKYWFWGMLNGLVPSADIN